MESNWSSDKKKVDKTAAQEVRVFMLNLAKEDIQRSLKMKKIKKISFNCTETLDEPVSLRKSKKCKSSLIEPEIFSMAEPRKSDAEISLNSLMIENVQDNSKQNTFKKRYSRKLTLFRKKTCLEGKKSFVGALPLTRKGTIGPNISNKQILNSLKMDRINFKKGLDTRDFKRKASFSLKSNPIAFIDKYGSVCSTFEQQVITIQRSFEYLFNLAEQFVEIPADRRDYYLTDNKPSNKDYYINENLFYILEIKGIGEDHSIDKNMINQVVNKKFKRKVSLLRVNEDYECKSFSSERSCSDDYCQSDIEEERSDLSLISDD